MMFVLLIKMFYHTEGKLVQIPGLPAMHDYEFFPQTVCVYHTWSSTKAYILKQFIESP